ncbi:MAG: hypothetical protein ACI4B3_09600, partial [Prevotella sp.]
WIMPARHLRTAMELYQPSGSKGKLLKRWFPLLHQMPLVRRAIHVETMLCRLNDELLQVLERAFNTNDLEFAIFCGTPCVHQKITMQISKENKILGYCKISDNDEIAALFDKEAQLLKELQKKGIKNIPECLYYGGVDNGTTLFVQSTEKSLNSEVVHDWDDMHEQFLTNMRDATTQYLKFEDSDYFQTLKVFEKHYDWLPVEVDKEMVRKAIEDTCCRWRGKEVAFSAYHADFTPWNMFVEKGDLFVFDWEYARMTYPPMLDKYHFFTQTAIFERHWKAVDIIRYIGSDEGKWVDADDYMAYLIEIIARFTIREKGNVNGDIAMSMKLWNELLSFLDKNKNESHRLFSSLQ